MVSPSDEAALQDAPIEEIEFDAAETEELDKLAEETRKGGISWEDLKAELGLLSDFLLAKNIRSPQRPPGSGPLYPLAFQLPRPQKPPHSGSPSRPRGLPGGQS